EHGQAMVVVRRVTAGTERASVLEDQCPWMRCGIRVTHPAREARDPGFAIEAGQVVPVETQRLPRRGAVEFPHQQVIVAGAGLPGDVPDRVAHMVFAQARELVTAGG